MTTSRDNETPEQAAARAAAERAAARAAFKDRAEALLGSTLKPKAPTATDKQPKVEGKWPTVQAAGAAVPPPAASAAEPKKRGPAVAPRPKKKMTIAQQAAALEAQLAPSAPARPRVINLDPVEPVASQALNTTRRPRKLSNSAKRLPPEGLDLSSVKTLIAKNPKLKWLEGKIENAYSGIANQAARVASAYAEGSSSDGGFTYNRDTSPKEGMPTFKAAINSLLNADPDAKENKGKPTVSFLSEESNIAKKLQGALDKNEITPEEDLLVVRALDDARTHLQKVLSSDEGIDAIRADGLKTALGTRLVFVNSRGALRGAEESAQYSDKLLAGVKLPPEILSRLTSSQGPEADKLAAQLQQRVIEHFSLNNKEETSLKRFRMDKAKMDDPDTLKAFHKAVQRDIDNFVQGKEFDKSVVVVPEKLAHKQFSILSTIKGMIDSVKGLVGRGGTAVTPEHTQSLTPKVAPSADMIERTQSEGAIQRLPKGIKKDARRHSSSSIV